MNARNTTIYTCPWCGTNYLTFQPNCQNCGGPLTAHAGGNGESTSTETPAPPLAPRSFSNGYVWRLLLTDGWWIVALVFGLIGGIFSVIGGGLAMGRFTHFIGFIFLALGVPFLLGGVGAFIWSYRSADKVVRVLREGLAAHGKIAGVDENLSVFINGRHPWIIQYEYAVNGQTYSGKVSTINRPGEALQAGNPAWVLYLAGEPQMSSLYPHP